MEHDEGKPVTLQGITRQTCLKVTPVPASVTVNRKWPLALTRSESR